MRFGNKNLEVFAVIIALAMSSACTLRKRAEAEEEKAKAKIAVETPAPPQAPAPDNLPNSLPPGEESTSPNANPDQPDSQTEMDLEKFNAPAYPEVTPNVLESETGSDRKRFTGFSDEAGLPFTDASSDSLAPYLRLRQNSAPESLTKASSLEFAHRILDAKLVDVIGSRFVVAVTVSVPSGKPTTFKLYGLSKLGGRYAHLAERQKNSLNHSSQSALQGELRCVDKVISKNCSTYLLSLLQNQSLGGGVAEVILRTTSMDAKVRLPKTPSTDLRVNELQEIFINSDSEGARGKHFELIEMQSFSVINGRAAFSLRMMTDTGEYLYFSGPLVTSLESAPLAIKLNRIPNKTDPANATWAPISSEALLKKIDAAHLTHNNGRGELSLELIIENKETKEPVAFSVTFTPANVPLLDLNQDSIYFRP